MSSCSVCGQKAVLALNLLMSTRSTRPRLQKCSTTLFFCDACVKRVAHETEPVTLTGLFETIRETHAAIVQGSDAEQEDRI